MGEVDTSEDPAVVPARRQDRQSTYFPDDGVPRMSEEEDAKRQELMKGAGNKRRAGVAAESVDNTAIKNYVKPVYEKDAETRERIKDTLKTNDKMQVLFGHLNGQPLEDVVNAFQTREAKGGEDIIQQGADGDFLFILGRGSVDIYVNRPDLGSGAMPPGKGSKVATFGPGALVGELALMYSAPRAATVTAVSECLLWVLDREPFKMLLAQQSQTVLEKYEGWLKEVDILKTLNHFELAKLSECMESELFDTGEVIMTQGDAGDKFYILEDGECAAYILGDAGEKEVKRYDAQGSYFGEVALLSGEPRKATIRALGEGCSVVSMSKEDFTNLLGPASDILKKHADMYPKYAEYLK